MDKPYLDAEELYTQITNTVLTRNTFDEFTAEIKEWMKDNRDIIVNISTHQKDNNFSIQIGSQHAKQIINVQGTLTINEIK